MLCPVLYLSTHTSQQILGIVTSRWRLSYSGMVGRSSCTTYVPVCGIRIQIGVANYASTTLDDCWNSFSIVPPLRFELRSLRLAHMAGIEPAANPHSFMWGHS